MKYSQLLFAALFSIVTLSAPLNGSQNTAYTQTAKATVQLQNIKLLIVDFDGVLTTDEVINCTNNSELRIFSNKDLEGIYLASLAGLNVVVLCNTNSRVGQDFSSKLNLNYFVQNTQDRVDTIRNLSENMKLTSQETAYMGCDVMDIPGLKYVAYPACPHDAISEVKNYCTFIAQKDGGRGAIRELIDLILQSKSSAQQ